MKTFEEKLAEIESLNSVMNDLIEGVAAPFMNKNVSVASTSTIVIVRDAYISDNSNVISVEIEWPGGNTSKTNIRNVSLIESEVKK